jgi:hypothetical protein
MNKSICIRSLNFYQKNTKKTQTFNRKEIEFSSAEIGVKVTGGKKTAVSMPFPKISTTVLGKSSVMVCGARIKG